jgi:hypothetical protein
LARKLNRRKGFAHALAGLGLCLLLALPILAGIMLDARLSQTDHRQEAGQWLENNIEPGAKIAIEHYAIPFDYDRYRVEDVVRAGNHDLDWYKREGFDLLIISDGVWELLRAQPEIYGDEVAAYEELVSGGTLAAEFKPEPPRLVVAGYPTVSVYHYAPVRIYRLPE